jgi:3-hydroxymyristoyl/3-hydroxydecanoyl-(acyl carrier protein) dehydratase
MNDSAEFTAQCCIPGNHPSLPGHFPGNPIVPGVVILDEVISAAQRWRGTVMLAKIPTSKFLSPLQAEQTFTIHLSEARNSGVTFRCTVGETLLASGQLGFI